VFPEKKIKKDQQQTAEDNRHEVHLSDSRTENKKNQIGYVMRKRAYVHDIPHVHLPLPQYNLVSGVNNIGTGI
jgi:hypothetical protein